MGLGERLQSTGRGYAAPSRARPAAVRGDVTDLGPRAWRLGHQRNPGRGGPPPPQPRVWRHDAAARGGGAAMAGPASAILFAVFALLVFKRALVRRPPSKARRLPAAPGMRARALPVASCARTAGSGTGRVAAWLHVRACCTLRKNNRRLGRLPHATKPVARRRAAFEPGLRAAQCRPTPLPLSCLGVKP